MDLKTKDEYKDYLSHVPEESQLDVAADLLVSKDHRIRNLQQGVVLFKGLLDAYKQKYEID